MDLLRIAENTVMTILLLGMPSLMVSMIIGLLISTFSAVTQINDASLTFVPKVIFVSGFILISLPWIGDKVEAYTHDLWDIILIFGQ
ncbi:flagellar biosynthetic protein FliQ [Arcobacter sp. HD9-500m-PIT-SAG03]|nr:flagellar export apparatus protein FliQ [Arcobacter sp. 31_11_sub10_T18]RDX34853.1 flagellar biosynthetic protein FliQ [Arcobacter sp. HD9-500m-PIT-SAG03]